MNKVIEIGRLGRDPELTYGGAHKDTSICKFTMAVDRPTEGTDWIRIIAFGKQAENCNKYLKKGSMVAVDGRIQTGSYDGKDGKKVYTTDVVANRVEFLTKPNSGGHQEEQKSESAKKVYTTDVVANRVEFPTKPNSGGHQEEQKSESATDAFIGVDEDLPF